MSLVYANGLLLLMVLIELAIFHFKMKKNILARDYIQFKLGTYIDVGS